MLRRIFCVVCAFILMFSVAAPGALAATVINEDVSIDAPVYSEIETAAEAANVNSQLTDNGSSASLSDDAAEGEFSLKVSAADETGSYAQYTLVGSDPFSTSTYSQISLWVKPGAGAGWISFYTNSTLITSDADGNGKFEVGTDLKSGTWTQITLDLLDTETPITTGDDLVVRSNENSVWYFDGITSKNTESTSIDLSTMVNDQTTLNNGRLEFKKTIDGSTYNASPTVLVSNQNKVITKEFTSDADFTGGTCENMTIYGGSIVFGVDICSGGSAISSGDMGYAPCGNAFDDKNNTNWQSSTYANSAYIGYDFGTIKSVSGFAICTSNDIDSADLQYYDSATSTWITIETVSLTPGGMKYYRFGWDIQAEKWRLKATRVENPHLYWSVTELQFFSSYWSYTSSPIDIASTRTMSQGILEYSVAESYNLNVETQLSLDGGATWQEWNVLNDDNSIEGINSAVNLQNARIKYRISGNCYAGNYASTIYSVRIQLLGSVSEEQQEPIIGTLEGINIDSSTIDVNGESSVVSDSTTWPSSLSYSSLALTGDGKTLYYLNSSNICALDLQTGITSVVASPATLGLNSISSFKVNYDGTVICVIYANNLVRYCTSDDTSAQTGVIRLAGGHNVIYDVQNDGGIAYYYYSSNADPSTDTGYLKYCELSGAISTLKSGLISTSKYNITDLAVAKETGDVFYIYSGNNLCAYSADYSYATTYGPFSGVSSILCADNEDNIVFVSYNDGYCSYDVDTKVIRPLASGISEMKPLDNGDFVVKDSKNSYYIYNPSTNEKVDITPSDINTSNPAVLTDCSGATIVYRAKDNYKIKYLNAVDKVNKYLLSFDGKNTWYSYRNGTWTMVSGDKTPTDSVFCDYGMTAEQMNALSKTDFAKLYTNGNEIYTVDVAVYFNSVSYEYTPSISSIQIITDTNSYGDASSSTANPLYAAKSTDFDGSGWRTIKRIYPVEGCDKDSDYLYFFYANGKYMYYADSAWHVEETNEISSLISDVKANWIDLRLVGMTSGEVRAIPQSALTAQLAGSDFSVVYCMRVPDKSTEGYTSLITADYTEQLYGSGTLTLTITYSNGSTQQIPGMTKIQVEDFMEWLLYRTKSSSTYFTVTVGSEHYYICYYMISNTTVTES